MANITAAPTFAGIRGTDGFVTNADRDSWRPGFTTLFPNGDLPLTAMTNRMKKRVIKNRKFHWWNKLPGLIHGKIAGIYTDVALSSAYTTDTGVGSVVYVKLTTTNGKTAAVAAASFVVGNGVTIRDETDPTADVQGEVINVVVNGSSSYIAVRLLEADDNSLYSRDLSDAATGGTLIQNGTINSEGSEPPPSVAYDPDEYENITQIFKDSLDLTGTALETELSYGDVAYEEAKKDALFRHGTGMENAFLWGIQTESVGSNGKRKRTTRGLIPTIRAYAPDNVAAFNLATAYAGKTWVEKGEEFLDTYLTQIWKYGRSDKMVFAGAGAISGLNALARTYGHITITPGQTKYGLAVDTWVTPWGTLKLKRHPLFTHMGTYNNALLIFEPENLTYVHIRNRDTKFFDDKDKKNSGNLDGLQEYFQTEAGLEFNHSISNGLLFGVGQDSAV